MKGFVICVAVLGLVALATARPSGKYTVKYDNVDLKEILSSERLTDNYVLCLLDKRPCTPDGEELKRVLPEALRTDCAKCSQKQREGSALVLGHLYKHRNATFNTLQKRYDPQNVYFKKHEQELKNAH